MDLVYIPEVLAFGSFRSPQYRDYEQPWNKDYFSCKKSSQSQPQRTQQLTQVKGKCYLCRETKRRRLAAYIRSKSIRDSCQGIHEEEEEEEEEKEKETEENTQKKENTDGEKKTEDAKQNKFAISLCDTKKQKSQFTNEQ